MLKAGIVCDHYRRCYLETRSSPWKSETMRGLVLSDHQGDMLPHLISPDSALTEVSSSWKESSPSSSQVHESTTPFSQNPEALGELCAAQAGHTTAYKGEGESCLLHSNLHNGLGCSNEGVLEAKPRYSARYTSDGADASPPSTAIMPISWQSTVRLVNIRMPIAAHMRLTMGI